LFPTLPSIVILEEKAGIHRWSWQLLKLPKATTKRRVRYRLMNDTAPISA
jgi:hypothetical protein